MKSRWYHVLRYEHECVEFGGSILFQFSSWQFAQSNPFRVQLRDALKILSFVTTF